MKFAVAAASVLASVYSQTTQAPTTPKLDAKCLDDANGVERLLIEIPYPEASSANILYLVAGDCSASDYESRGGDIDRSNDMVKIWIPIDECKIRGDVYQIPTVNMTKSYGLSKPTATVTFGQKIGGMDIIFRRLPIAAECGTRTSYTVKFDYNNVTQVDADGCTMVGEVCVFPAYGQEAKFDIKEYTNANFNVEVDSSNRASVAGEEIFLSLQVTDMPSDLKFAVTECKITDGNQSLILLNPGAEASADPPPSCKITEIGLSGAYDGFEKFNFQHLLFLLNAALEANTFTLECEVDVCNRNDASSTCNQAAAVCIKDSTEVVAEQEKFTKDYMCDGLCGTGKEDHCSFDADKVSCKACTCEFGVAAVGNECLSDSTEVCLTCDEGYTITGTDCVSKTCTCDNGTGASGISCPVQNDKVCAVCDSGFELSGNSCVPSGPIPEYECDKLTGDDYLSGYKRLHPNTCTFDPASFSSGNIGSYSSSPINSNGMKVWYFKTTDPKPQEDGRTFCESLGLVMGTFYFENEYVEVRAVLGSSDAWIGAEYAAQGNKGSSGSTEKKAAFKWMNGQKMCLDKWSSNEPNSDGTINNSRVWIKSDGTLDDFGDYSLTHPGRKKRILCEYRCAD